MLGPSLRIRKTNWLPSKRNPIRGLQCNEKYSPNALKKKFPFYYYYTSFQKKNQEVVQKYNLLVKQTKLFFYQPIK